MLRSVVDGLREGRLPALAQLVELGLLVLLQLLLAVLFRQLLDVIDPFQPDKGYAMIKVDQAVAGGGLGRDLLLLGSDRGRFLWVVHANQSRASLRAGDLLRAGRTAATAAATSATASAETSTWRDIGRHLQLRGHGLVKYFVRRYEQLLRSLAVIVYVDDHVWTAACGEAT